MFELARRTFHSRLLVGSAQYPSLEVMRDAIAASGTEVVTVSLRRQTAGGGSGNAFWRALNQDRLAVLPNTAGCHSAEEAIVTAQMARELFDTHWIKLEVIGDDSTLQPDPFGLLEAARELLGQGFEVFPYCTDDLVLCDRLLGAGCRILMPWGAPIGSGLGIDNAARLAELRRRYPDITLIVDAGIGAPSHAARAMELGCDAVLLNSAIARAGDPVAMASAFKSAVEAGRRGFEAGLMPTSREARPSTPDIGKPFWHA
ncbi:thiazole synthase [Parahaliea mediterranea]|uniref:Thiazole synthase n=1 Tax=Parahaliea mediterranea TaxID=651086 RepID=A0A939DIY7_9GAMM|nr:thiazole synthase [Parahaliea mediterranea]MBN7798701.1 thiazole synthase [Parahaliea mediterranea]